MYKTAAVASLAVMCFAGAARADFVNGGFESGDFTGWTVTPTANGQTLSQVVESFDIDFGGPLSASLAGRFQVGQVSPQAGVPAGIELTQMLQLTGGVTYTISFNWAATRLTPVSNNQGGIFDLIVNGASIANALAGPTSSTTQNSGFLTADFTPGSTGMYSIGARMQRPFTIPADLFQYVDNFTLVPAPGALALLGLGGLLAVRRRR